MIKSYGVKINDKHSFDDFELIMTGKEISSPTPKLKLIEVPGRDGDIDLSEVLTGDVVYENREIKMSFYSPKKIEDWSNEISEINRNFAGKIVHLIFDDDMNFYWNGRITSIQPKYDGPNETLEIKVTADPFKYDVVSSAVDWEWDSFDFDTGIINEMGQLVVDGTTKVTLICRTKIMVPIFKASTSMTVEYDNETYNLKAGEQKLYELFLKEGENELIFRGNGTITIDYVGGVL